jgi:hypothetical protein
VLLTNPMVHERRVSSTPPCERERGHCRGGRRRSCSGTLGSDGAPVKGHVLENLDMDQPFDCKILLVQLPHLATKGQRRLTEQFDRGEG